MLSLKSFNHTNISF